MMSIFEVAPLAPAVIEHAVLYRAEIHHGCQLIVTRNGKDFTKANIPVMPLMNGLHC